MTYDPGKRAKTLAERGLDFRDALHRFDYAETRWQTVGLLGGVMVMVVWTPRGDDIHVISMRKCNARERPYYWARMGRS